MSSGTVVIRGGRVLDPGQELDLPSADVLVVDGQISAVGERLEIPQGAYVFDASGCIVSPGWIDMHAHLYHHATTLGVAVDSSCLERGVTTAADAGSAGAMTLAGLRHFVAEPSQTRVLAWLHAAAHGLAGAACAGGEDGVGGECDSLNVLKVQND
jgi:dihydroorotase